MKLAVVGSRSITDEQKFLHAFERAPWLPNGVRTLSPIDVDLTIVSGGADGVDTLAQEWAEERGFETDIKEPDWDDWSNGYPAIVRNTDIIEAADCVLAVWDGKSSGTRDTIDKALDRGIPVYVEVVE